MGLSRRMFTKEFKLAAVQRLERGEFHGRGASTGAEVNPNELHRLAAGGRLGKVLASCPRVRGTSVGPKGRISGSLERKIGQPWRLIF